MNVDVFAKTARVVISDGLRIAECCKQQYVYTLAETDLCTIILSSTPPTPSTAAAAITITTTTTSTEYYLYWTMTNVSSTVKVATVLGEIKSRTFQGLSRRSRPSFQTYSTTVFSTRHSF